MARVRTAVTTSYGLSDIPKWIVDKTRLRNLPYSFKDHEFQLKVVSDFSRVVNVQKCAQVGLSEVMSRYAVALTCTLPNFNTIITFPYSGDATDFARTRIDPMIAESPFIQQLVNNGLNNSEIKQFLASFLYFRGTSGSTQAISIPADAIISDEIDRSDPHILSQYTSRLNHSPWKLRRNFSTPTLSGYGVSGLMATSRRFRNLCKCNHCNHWFNPDYFNDVKIPGYDQSLRQLTKHTIQLYRWQEAKLLCPRCGQQPSLQLEHRNWVQENPRDNHEAAGYFIQPFDAPNLVAIPGLVHQSTEYKRYTEFVNQGLGLVEADSRETLLESDVEGSMHHVDLGSAELVHSFGADMGLLCTIVISRFSAEGKFLVVHRERVPIGKFQERKKQLCSQYRCMMKVCDSQPYVDTIIQLQKTDSKLYGAVYVKLRGLEAFKIKQFEGEAIEGKLPIHVVSINRNKAFDELMGVIKRGDMIVSRINDLEDETFKSQLLDMKRVQVVDEHGEGHWTWQKSEDGDDHYHHATLYSYVAAKLRPMASAGVPLGVPGGFLFGKMSLGGLNRPSTDALTGRTLVRR